MGKLVSNLVRRSMAKQVNLILDDDVHEAFKAKCRAEGVSMVGKLTEWVRHWIPVRTVEEAIDRAWAEQGATPLQPTPPTLVKVLHPKNQKVYEVTEGLELQQALAKGYTLVEEKA